MQLASRRGTAPFLAWLRQRQRVAEDRIGGVWADRELDARDPMITAPTGRAPHRSGAGPSRGARIATLMLIARSVLGWS